MKKLLLSLALAFSACGPVLQPVPTPTPPRALVIRTCVPGATVWLDGALIVTTPQIADASGTVGWPAIAGAATAFNLHATAPNYTEYGMVVPLPPGNHRVVMGPCEALTDPALQIVVREWRPNLPPAPSREEILTAQGCFQGITVHTEQFGDLPMFDPALSSFSAKDRQASYAAWHSAGCKIVSLSIAWDYGGAGQPYGSGQLVPPTDLRSDVPRLRALLTEVIQAGFFIRFHLAGDGTEPGPYIYGYRALVDDLPRVIAALRAPIDLTRYLVFVPGFDGIISYNEQSQGFEPWTMAQLSWYLVELRQLCADCYSAVEPSIGPLGGTLPTFLKDAALTNYYRDEPYDALDQILNEFPPGTDQHGALSWQIADRILGPAFVRPGDMVGDEWAPDVAHWSLTQLTSRGRIVPVAYEFDTYEWVRRHIEAFGVAINRAYYRAMGYLVTG